MRTKILIIFLFISIQTFSQSNKFEMGASLGVGLTEFKGITSQENNILGSSLGLMFQYNATKLFSIHSNLLYESKALEIPESDWQCTTCPKNSTFLGFEYLTLPVLARLNFGSKAKFFINAGPYFGYLINNNWIDSRFDFGLSTGLGGQIDLNEKLNLSLELRNSLNLMPSTTTAVEYENIRSNNTINLFFVIAYKLGSENSDE